MKVQPYHQFEAQITIPTPPKITSCSRRCLPLLALPALKCSSSTLPTCPSSLTLRGRESRTLRSVFKLVRSQADAGVGSSSYGGEAQNDDSNVVSNVSSNDSSQLEKRRNQIPYPLSVAMVFAGCALVFSLIMFVKGDPSSLLAAISKTGFTAAFMLIFVSEIGDKTFFIAALLAMQYEKGLCCGDHCPKNYFGTTVVAISLCR